MRAQLCRRAHVRLTLITDDLVGHPKLLEQPQHALGAGVIEVMDGKHGGSFGDWLALWCEVGGASRRPESRVQYYPGIIDMPIYPGNIFLAHEEIFMNRDPTPPTSPSQATAALRPANSGRLSQRRKRHSIGARMPRYLSSMAEPAARSTSIFAAPSAKCWRGCRRSLALPP